MAVFHVKNHELVWQFQIYTNHKVLGFSAYLNMTFNKVDFNLAFAISFSDGTLQL